MSDSLMTIVAIFLAAVLMFIFPLMSVAERNDDIAQQAVQTTTTEFAVKVATKGKITSDDYQEYLSKIATTGNTYEVEIEVQKLDENIGKKAATTNKDLIGENSRYSVFLKTDIEEQLADPNKGVYLLNKGDNVIITAKNTNTTMAQTLRGFFYKVTGKGTYQIGASASATAVNSGNY